MAWYNANWDYRVKVTIQNAQVDADLTDFPVYVNLNNLPAEFHTNVNQTDARDIRVTKSDGTTELPREVVFYTAASDTGELHFKADAISNSADTDFYIYYGNAAATEPALNDTYGAENVWTNSYSAVYHLHEGDSTTADFYKDSTTNDNDGTLVDADGDTAVGTGQLGNGMDFNGDADYIALAQTAGLPIYAQTTYSVSLWVNGGAQTNKTAFGEGSTSSNSPIFAIGPRANATSGAVWMFIRDTSGATKLNANSTTTTAFDGSLRHIYWTDTNGTAKLYIDGALDATSFNYTRTATAVNTSSIGAINRATAIQFFDGIVDELRLHTAVRSAEWIDAEFTNQKTPTTFYSVGAEETESASSLKTFDGLVVASHKIHDELVVASRKTINGLV